MHALLKMLQGGDRRSIGKVQEDEKKEIVKKLFLYLNDKSKIVVTFALQALADLALEDKNLQPRIIRVLEEFTQTGSPAIKSRGRKLLKQLKGIN